MRQNEISRRAKPGQIVVVDINFRPIRVRDTLTSWAAKAYRKNADGSFTCIN